MTKNRTQNILVHTVYVLVENSLQTHNFKTSLRPIREHLMVLQGSSKNIHNYSSFIFTVFTVNYSTKLEEVFNAQAV